MRKIVNCIIVASICIIVGITVCFALSACHGKEVNRFPIDKRFIPAHTQTWTTYTTIKVGKEEYDGLYLDVDLEATE